MVRLNTDVSDANVLRERLARFLTSQAASKAPLREALGRLEIHGWSAVIFGGVLRDLFVYGASETPRDVDVVILGASLSEFEHAFQDLIYEKTRFGGLRLRTKDWLIDIWRLGDTWAFREHLVPDVSFAQLVRTTFLNVEAIAAEIFTTQGKQRRIYSHGFLEAVKRRVVDINFEPNPFPALCVVRSLITAIKLNFSMSRRLAEYIVLHGIQTPNETLMQAQESHYGKIPIGSSRMAEYLSYIEHQLGAGSDTIQLPTTRAEQLDLMPAS
jgi:hypothetical protein